MKPSLLGILVASISLFAGNPSQATGPAEPNFGGLNLEGGLVTKLELPGGEAWKAFSVPVIIAGAPHTLDLEPRSIRADDFELVVVDAEGHKAIAPPVETTYAGTVRGLPGSTVAATLISGEHGPEFRAMVQVPGLETYWVEPMPGAGDAEHVVYGQSQSREIPGVRCGVEEMANLPLPVLRQLVPPTGSPDAFLVCELGIDSDFEYYSAKSGSNITTLINDISNIINMCATIYQTDANVTFKITHFIVRTVAAGQPYTSTDPNTLLTQLDTEWSTNNGGIRRDLTHLFTGKNMAGGVIGIAYLNAVCSAAIGYGLSESKYGGNLTSRVALTAHEVGHNFSAGHCDTSCSPCTIMCSGIGGCAGPLTNFGCSAAGIASYAAGRVCLNDANTAPSPLAIPFEDLFPAALDTKKWTANFGGATSAGGTNEPSPTLSLNLDSADVIHSVWLDTKTVNLSPVFLSFYSQPLNVPAGQSLQVQCYNPTTNLYQTVATIPSDGSAQSVYSLTEVALPATCLSSVRSRLRFAVAGTAITQDWFIDNVSVDIYCRVDINKDRVLDISDFIDFQTAFALNDVLSADFTDDFSLSIDDFIAFQTFFAIGCY